MQRLKIDSNRRFLVTEDGAPFFWLGDTAWELFHRLTLEDASYYLENRRQKGFNVVLAVALAELDGLRHPNPNGDLPLIDMNPLTPNEAYFQHIDAIIEMAAAKNIYIALLPTWGDKVNLRWGVGPVIFNEHNAHTYGRFMGRRYCNADNIIWINGGDREEITDGVDYSPVWRSLAAGIKSEASQLMSYHPQGGRGSSMAFHTDKWLDFNMWQSGHHKQNQPIWTYIQEDYHRQPTKPVLDGEPNYEDHPINFDVNMGYFREYDVRKQAYRAVFAGWFGHTYGHHSIWQMVTDKREPVNAPDRTWQAALDRPGASQLHHLRDLMLSRPFLSRIPDQTLIVSTVGTGGQHMRATRDSNGMFAMVYIPEANQEVRFNLAFMHTPTAAASWFDPRTGTTTLINTVTTIEEQAFISPSEGPDWVLVIDASK